MCLPVGISVHLNTLHIPDRQSRDYAKKENSNVKQSSRLNSHSLAVDSKTNLSLLDMLARGHVFMPL